MLNPILEQITGSQNNIMMQAIGAMIRGESPQAFLKNLAKNNPQLNGLDLDHPEQAAEELYSKNGQDINEAKSSIKDKLSSFMGK